MAASVFYKIISVSYYYKLFELLIIAEKQYTEDEGTNKTTKTTSHY